MGGGAFTLAMYEGKPKWPLTTVTGFGAGLGPRSLGGTNVRPPLVTPSATAVLGTTLITASSAARPRFPEGGCGGNAISYFQ